jgi:hypothetical protein
VLGINAGSVNYAGAASKTRQGWNDMVLHQHIYPQRTVWKSRGGRRACGQGSDCDGQLGRAARNSPRPAMSKALYWPATGVGMSDGEGRGAVN